MTDADLDDLEHKAKAATPGPWGFWSVEGEGIRAQDYTCGVMGPFHKTGEGGANDLVCETTKPNYDVEQANADAEFIATANPIVVLSLVAELRKARSR